MAAWQRMFVAYRFFIEVKKKKNKNKYQRVTLCWPASRTPQPIHDFAPC